MIITTTNNIEGYKIIEYLEPIIINKTANVIDIREYFLGIQNPEAPLSEMENLKSLAMKTLEEETIKLEGNAVIGLSLDYDEIGGVSGGMLMLNLKGTPVKIEKFDPVMLLFKYHIEKDPYRKIALEIEMKKNNIDDEVKRKIYPLIKEQIEEINNI